MNCESFRDLYELYSLGVLEGKEKCEMEEHLATGCPTCETEIRRALDLNAAISSTVPLADPPARLRSRILNSFHEEAHPIARPEVIPIRSHWRPSAPWLAAAASLLAIIGLIWRITYQQRENAARYEQISEATRILQAPETKTVPFGPQQGGGAYGKLFVNPTLGAVIAAADLPAAPSGWTYESWIVPKTGNPKPVRPFAARAGGQAFTFVPGPIDTTQVMAIAVSMEPPAAHLDKPTRVLFAAPV